MFRRRRRGHRLGRDGFGRADALFAGGLVAGSMAIVLLLVFPWASVPPPGGGSGGGWGGGTGRSPPPTANGSPTLEPGPIVSVTPSTFWGVVVQTSSSVGITSDPGLGNYLNQTPFTWYSYTLDTDNCNMSSNTFYSDGGKASHPCPFNITAFATWCRSRGPGCHSILKLPGENDDPGEDAYLASWVVHAVGFQPDLWAIGNEPMLWTHYDIPWAEWRSTDRSVPTPAEYGADAEASMAAVARADPGAHFLAIESDCQCSWDYVEAAVSADSAYASAVGYHTYPSTWLRTNETPLMFFAPLTSDRNISSSFANVTAAVRSACASCSLPVYVTEYNSGPGRGATQWAGTFLDAVFLAASTVQALRANVTMFLVYNLQSENSTNRSTMGWGLLTSNGTIGPEGRLYSQIFEHFATGRVEGTGLSTSVGSVWTLDSENATNQSLLLVNANTTEPVTIGLGAVLPAAAGATVYEWTQNESAPVSYGGEVPATVTLPPLSMLMVNVPLSADPFPTG
jgi:hypothetical protein